MQENSEQGHGVTRTSGEDAREARITELEARVDSLIRALRLSEPDQFRDLIDLFPQFVFAKDWNGRFIFANKANAALYNSKVNELVGRLHSDVHDSPEEVAMMLADDREVMTSGSTLYREESFIDGRGRRRFLQKIKVPFRLPGDNLPAVLGIATDITEFRSPENAQTTTRVEDERDEAEVMELRASNNRMVQSLATRDDELRKLRRALEASEAASRAKDTFMTNVSHELRTPMTAIIGFTEQLLNEAQALELPRNQQDSLHIIQQNSEQLLAVVNDLINAPISMDEQPDVRSAPLEIPRLLCQVVSLMHRQAAAKQIGFHVESVGPIPERIMSDITRVRQILINLIGNAITYTDTGSVTVRIRCLDMDLDDPKIRFDVVDTGRGLSQELQSALFQRFAHADAGILAGGHHGLGLVISKKLARMLGGDLIIRSRIGEGSTFSFIIRTGSLVDVPLLDDAVNPALGVIQQDVSLRPLPEVKGRILLVEDVEVNRTLISKILTDAGAQVTAVLNGADACDVMTMAAERREPYDLIFMDMQMPVMDGYEATRTLREQGYTLPIIALTAHAMSGDEEKCLLAGCDHYVSKPVKRRALLELTASYLERAAD